MPVYVYECEKCFFIVEKIQDIVDNLPDCTKCEIPMKLKPTYPAMVKIKGSGGYPSRRKMIGDTAPYCRG